MRASEIRVGDELPGHYWVRRVEPRENGMLVVVVVEFLDGGLDRRRWSPGEETPLVRPEPEPGGGH